MGKEREKKWGRRGDENGRNEMKRREMGRMGGGEGG